MGCAPRCDVGRNGGDTLLTPCIQTQIEIQADYANWRDAKIKSAIRSGIDKEKIRRQFQVSEFHMRVMIDQVEAEEVTS